MKKTLISSSLIFAALLMLLNHGVGTAALANEYAKQEQGAIRSVQDRDTRVLVDNEMMSTKLVSVAREGDDSVTMYMPLRGILEDLDYCVDWDGENDMIRIDSPSSRKVIGEDIMYIKSNVDLGYMDLQVADIEIDAHTKWNILSMPDGIMIKMETRERDGKLWASFLADTTKSVPGGRRLAILEQSVNGKASGKYAVLDINVASGPADMKPVIYLYPQEETDVSVTLDYDGVLDVTYPDYDGEWSVTAFPDGTLINHADGLEYSYLFWEGSGNSDYELGEGFVVKGVDTAEFLREQLAYMGLKSKEYNEFIVYWLPQMINNPYNLISFQGENYTEKAKLNIEPAPDSVLRVFMAWKPMDYFVEVHPQKTEPFERKGFTVLEWGGAKVN